MENGDCEYMEACTAKSPTWSTWAIIEPWLQRVPCPTHNNNNENNNNNNLVYNSRDFSIPLEENPHDEATWRRQQQQQQQQSNYPGSCRLFSDSIHDTIRLASLLSDWMLYDVASNMVVEGTAFETIATSTTSSSHCLFPSSLRGGWGWGTRVMENDTSTIDILVAVNVHRHPADNNNNNNNGRLWYCRLYDWSTSCQLSTRHATTRRRTISNSYPRRNYNKLDHDSLCSFTSLSIFLTTIPRLSLVVEAIRTMQLAQAAFQEHATLYNTWSNQQQQQQQSKATSEEHRVPPLPDWWIDTTGCAFTFWVAKFGYGCRILPYVHYPTISTDMLRVVYQPRPVYGVAPHAMGQSSAIVPTMNTTTRPMVYTGLKLIYYTLFACAYGLTGSLADYVMVNSTWTYQHIRTWWKLPAWRKRIRVVYPPCLIPANPTMTTTTTTTTAVNINNSSTYSDTPQREAIIVSIGQFRPEKDHMLQILAMERLLQYYPNLRERKVKMVLIGSCRPNAADQERLQMLRTYAKELPIEFVVNQPQGVVQEWFRRGSVGIHTVRGTKHGVGYPYEWSVRQMP